MIDEREQALLARVIAAPDDDAPRMVYADYLDERSGPTDAARAEFIRVQLALARIKPRYTVDARWISGSIPTDESFTLSGAGGVPPWPGDLIDARFPDPRGGDGASFTRIGPLGVLNVEFGRGVEGRGNGEWKARVAFAPDPDEIRRAALQERERKFARNAEPDPFRQPLFDWSGGAWGWALNVVFRRGFVEGVVTYGRPWRKHGDEACRKTPLRWISLETVPPIHWQPMDDQGLITLDTGTRQRTAKVPNHDWQSVLLLLQLGWPGISFYLPGQGGQLPRHVNCRSSTLPLNAADASPRAT